MRQMILNILFAMLLAASPVYGGDPKDFGDLPGDPVDPEQTITIDPPDTPGAATGQLTEHWRSVPNIETGMRLALPRAADGTCQVDSIVNVEGVPRDRITFDADKRHFYSHQIDARVHYSIDSDTCEVVVGEVIARDHVRRRPVKRASPRLIEQIPPGPPDPGTFGPQSSLNPRYSSDDVRFDDPCILYQFEAYSRRTMYAIYTQHTIMRAQIKADYWDYPWTTWLHLIRKGSTAWIDPLATSFHWQPQSYIEFLAYEQPYVVTPYIQAKNDLFAVKVVHAVEGGFWLGPHFTCTPGNHKSISCPGREYRSPLWPTARYDHTITRHHFVKYAQNICP